MKKYYIILLGLSFLIGSCIKNDIPFPTVFGEIEQFSINGQQGQSIISTDKQTVEITMPFGTDLTELAIDNIVLSEGAKLMSDTSKVRNFSIPVVLRVETYQEYLWEIKVKEGIQQVDVTSFKIKGQVASSIDVLTKTVRVVVPVGTDVSNLEVEEMDFIPVTAKSSKDVLTIKDFSTPVSVVFNGSSTWTIRVTIEGQVVQGEQLPFADFKTWYQHGTGANSFYLPGNDLTSIWQSGDRGASELTIKTYPQTVVPYPSFSQQDYAVLETKTAVGIIAAGSLFVGSISGSGISDVVTDFGVPFTDRPTSFSTEIQYQPKKYNGSTVDECDVFVILQVREGGKNYRLATGWFRTDKAMSTFEVKDIPMIYGNSNALASYMMPSTSNKELPEEGFYSDINAAPTHIVVAFSSSAHGAKFEGAEGSKLKVKGIKLNYN
ncbi:PCMD domain-containing protein [Flammeovirga kamogawensis]|uniref:PCMD domain-containing protein n=1 Tax=Flammeovirga kamogawensis TaxID=373891 RepID=A0ABX8H4R9_9BACT|nr:PCMD domain-containing protein [Flammeovirga kamogawensis]MBB6461828.1 hypothetical protein [Flammeovirga kamogawensis]QWG10743.1 PCMD domain-containing protein [Flammeovirga kamogawensis]TRX63845.1 hypothetical protein EO216_25875 [Flammeovirga kamogawensis]